MHQSKVLNIMDHGTHITAFRYYAKSGETLPDKYRNAPYRVFTETRYSRKQIAKCEDLCTCLSVAYQYIMNGG